MSLTHDLMLIGDLLKGRLCNVELYEAVIFRYLTELTQLLRLCFVKREIAV